MNKNRTNNKNNNINNISKVNKNNDHRLGEKDQIKTKKLVIKKQKSCAYVRTMPIIYFMSGQMTFQYQKIHELSLSLFSLSKVCNDSRLQFYNIRHYSIAQSVE